MATMDIFEGDAFSVIELTRALENIPFKPATLSGSDLFGERGVRTRTVVIESRDGTLSLIPFSERGGGYDQQTPESRQVRAFVCRQFKKQDVLWASEIQGIREFGSESVTQQAQAEVARRMRRLRADAEATFEYHLLNGIQGLVKDPRDGAVVINFANEFGITPAAEIDFDLDNQSPASGALRKRCQALIESVEDSLGGLAVGPVQLRAECGSAFFADLVAHKEIRETYLNTAAANELRGRVVDEFTFGGITFRRYGGSATIGVPTDKAFFYPQGIEGLFEIYFAPADTFETVNTIGLPLYARMIPDRERDEWVRLEIESNPLPICTRPQVLRSARRTYCLSFPQPSTCSSLIKILVVRLSIPRRAARPCWCASSRGRLMRSPTSAMHGFGRKRHGSTCVSLRFRPRARETVWKWTVRRSSFRASLFVTGNDWSGP